MPSNNHEKNGHVSNGTNKAKLGDQSKVGRGGRRPGAGRKPSLATQVKREMHTELADAGRYALALMIAIAKDETAPQKVRLEAARLLADRSFGKPTARVEYSQSEPPAVDADQQRALLGDPEACELAASLDARLALPPGRGREGAWDRA